MDNNYKFIFTLITSIIFSLSIILFINYSINPFNYFKKSGNNFLSSSFFSKTSPSNIMYKMTEDLKYNKLKEIIIGSSRTLYGFNTCEKDILKVGKTGITLNETNLLLNEALKNKNIKTIFIEVGILDTNKNKVVSSIQPSFWEANFTLNALYVSIRTFFEYLFEKQTYQSPNCNFKVFKVFHEANDKKLLDYYNKISSDLFLKNISFFISTLIENKDLNNKKIIFFLPPINSQITNLPIKELISKKFKDKINVNPSVKFISYNEVLKVNDSIKQDWYDLNHFKPILGNKFLEKIQTMY
ncbi:hypothetical protein CRU99_08060 [Malaciobacter mytili]|nr:hypothetical protein CRU99_08060 [Malaciobacter mytili]